MTQSEELHEILDSVRNGEWNTNGFTLKKAYITSILSQMAYEHIPEFERAGINRLKLVPCREYWAIIQEEKPSDLRLFIQRSNMGNEGIKVVFIIEEVNLICIGILCYGVLFVVLRGTHHMYKDNMVNLRARKVRRYYKQKYHYGFYREVSKIFGRFKEELTNIEDSVSRVIYTGHSLGGALATILYYETSSWRSYRFSLDSSNNCYVFGMPRIGNRYATEFEGEHYHILNKLDVIPTLPPKFMGYSNVLKEVYLTGTSIDRILIREKIGTVTWLKQLKGLSDHRIGEYKRRLKRLLDR
ncbi:lipase family protein [Cohnella endophytica]|uniref:Lipase family protein n=1 Tax=Cohnella endophytica TaxID=2419778 RepID=A0A494X2C3_9BACL|nr:lipase family protein [Cohnella endophytica]RKP44480.1 lipase family protein [Cohnella endophytica]